jgi:hypothetical protein
MYAGKRANRENTGADTLSDGFVKSMGAKLNSKKKGNKVVTSKQKKPITIKISYLSELSKKGFESCGTGIYKDAKHHLWTVERSADGYTLSRNADEDGTADSSETKKEGSEEKEADLTSLMQEYDEWVEEGGYPVGGSASSILNQFRKEKNLSNEQFEQMHKELKFGRRDLKQADQKQGLIQAIIDAMFEIDKTDDEELAHQAIKIFWEFGVSSVAPDLVDELMGELEELNSASLEELLTKLETLTKKKGSKTAFDLDSKPSVEELEEAESNERQTQIGEPYEEKDVTEFYDEAEDREVMEGPQTKPYKLEENETPAEKKISAIIKVFTSSGKVKGYKIAFVATDDTYIDKGRLGGYILLNDKTKLPGYFEYNEETGLGWDFENNEQVTAVLDQLYDANDNFSFGIASYILKNTDRGGSTKISYSISDVLRLDSLKKFAISKTRKKLRGTSVIDADADADADELDEVGKWWDMTSDDEHSEILQSIGYGKEIISKYNSLTWEDQLWDVKERLEDYYDKRVRVRTRSENENENENENEKAKAKTKVSRPTTISSKPF